MIAVRESAAEVAPFDTLSQTPAHHFDLYLYAAILRLRLALPGIAGAEGDAAAPFAFLHRYFAELPPWTHRDPDRASARWYEGIERWERDAGGHLPLRALRDDAGLDHAALTAWAGTALVEEDARFGSLFQALQQGANRPTAGLLASWWPDPDERRVARRSVDRLMRLGLVETAASEPPQGDSPLRPASGIWAVMRGDSEPSLDWCTYRAPEDAPGTHELVLAHDVERRVAALPRLLAAGRTRTIVIRGPGGSGRRTVIAALARTLGFGCLDLEPAAPDERRWLLLGPLATALHAVPLIRLEPGIGENVTLPALDGYLGPIGITLPAHGSVRGVDLEHAVTLELGMPDATARRRHWMSALDGRWAPAMEDVADRYRMTGGNIRRVATIAKSTAALDGREAIAARDVLEAGRLLRSRALEPLATHVPSVGGWDDLVVDERTRLELDLLEQRCRARERLVDVLPSSVGLRSAGVRVLFTGPSGAGKTLAARLLGSVLAMDVYLADVGRLVDKFLGETEKNLSAVFSRAAELDALLLIDEGDSLLTGRTDVRTSNDRYANLQTNHLLQQLEAHDGIVVVTTNAGDRIDQAFLRRIDVVLEFRPPDAALRWEIWRRHLPPDNDVDEDALAEIATRCALMGGQIRNAVLHAWLLALDERHGRGVPTTRHVEAAVRREYTKLGAICPLPADGSTG